ncbi:hypothetical protein SAMN05444362_101514 [Dysgonomonas macrotermitis]|uniref:Uncharacterized protein n=1 Tax=Dysgonomonas macrotermitis TaxID=1346286 RepID=A0A1M4U5Y9_9BACT|nr:hypothetical protein SAMN05444362_101514 [Dysgonomonas macrotermitis]
MFFNILVFVVYIQLFITSRTGKLYRFESLLLFNCHLNTTLDCSLSKNLLIVAARCSECTLLFYFRDLPDSLLNTKTQRDKDFTQEFLVGGKRCFTRCLEKQDSALSAFFVCFVLKPLLSARAEPCPYNSGIYLFQLCEINFTISCVEKQSLLKEQQTALEP